MNTTIASARESQRYMLEKYFALITIFVINSILVPLVALWLFVNGIRALLRKDLLA